MSKPTTYTEKKLYQRMLHLDLDRMVYLPEGIDPFTYLEDYPNNRVIPVYTVQDNTVVSGTGLTPTDFPILLKQGGNVFNANVSADKKKIQIKDHSGVQVGQIRDQAVISQSFNGDQSTYLFSLSTVFSTASTMTFRGTNNVGTPTSIVCTVGQSAAASSIRIYDVTNALVVATGSISQAGPYPLILSNIGNFSAEMSTWEIQLRRDTGNGNQNVRLYSIDINF